MSAPRTREKPVVMKADTWDGESDLKGWGLTLKIDRWRFHYDPARGRLYTATGHVYAAPADWVKQLPPIPLDGELCVGGGRGQGSGALQKVASIVGTGLDGPPATGLQAKRWDSVEALIFDLRASDAGPWEDRRRILEHALREPPPRVRLLPETICTGEDHLHALALAVTESGGEGLMARRPGSPYKIARVPWLLKVKPWKDAEARVVGHTPGERACAGMMGALVCRLGADGQGVVFEIGTGFTHALRRSPPPVGALVRFRYEQLSTSGTPLKPSFIALRDEKE